MPTTSLKTAARRCALAATIGVGAFVAAPSAASAAGTNACDASALQLSLLGGVALDPIHANPSYAPCASDDRSLINVPSLLGLASADAVTTRTVNTANVNAVSESLVAGARVGITDGAVVGQLTNALLGQTGLVGQLTGQLGAIPGLTLVPGLVDGLVGTISGNLLADVLAADVIGATARAQCVNGSAQLSGQSQIAGLRVLGTTVDANAAANQLLTIDTANLRLGDVLSIEDLLRGIKVGDIGLPAALVTVLVGEDVHTVWDLLHAQQTGNSVVGVIDGLLSIPPLPLLLQPLGLGSVGQIVGNVVDPLVAALQEDVLNQVVLNIPPSVLRAQITPNAQAIVGDQLTQQALTLSVSLLNQPILSGTIAQARVGAGAPGCVPAKPEEPKSPVKNPDKYTSPEAEAFLQCANRAIDLIDVFGQGSRTFVQGVAERKYVGKTATIYLAHGKKKVGTVKVGEDGLFSTKVALPPKKIRKTNKARYYAVIDGKKTRALKFARRMETRGLTASSDSVTFRGRVVGPLQKRQQKVTIKQRITCKSYKTVATVKPDSKGRFTVKIKAPAGDGAVIYRAQTKVGKRKNAKRLSPTFTLPRVVGLR